MTLQKASLAKTDVSGKRVLMRWLFCLQTLFNAVIDKNSNLENYFFSLF